MRGGILLLAFNAFMLGVGVGLELHRIVIACSALATGGLIVWLLANAD